MRDLLDAAWGDFPTDDIGHDWSRYTGAARPDPGWVTAVVAHSRLTFIQESYSTRSSEGYDVGVVDCRYAEARAREVYPGYRGSIVVAVSDGDSGDHWDASGYGHGWADAATLAFLPYGTPSICASFCAGAGSNPLNLWGDMVPETWGTTVAPMRRLITQTVGASPVPNTDLDIVHAPYYLDAPAAPTPPPEEDEMYYRIYTANDSAEPWFLTWIDPTLHTRVKVPIDNATANAWAAEQVFSGVPNLYASIDTNGPHPYTTSAANLDLLPAPPTAASVSLTDAQIKKFGAAVSIDPAAIAKAVNDDAAARMAS